jgi:GNAT superfamily N-acetyltransferase
MALIRSATVEDAALIAHQRRRMFVDAGQPDDARMHSMEAAFLPWVESRLKDATYLGWLATEEGRIIGGAGMWLMNFPPHFLHIETVRAYLLNFYVDPEFRGRGLARTLLQTALAEARRLDIEIVTLHASKYGRPLYEQNGFQPTNEMMLRPEASAPTAPAPDPSKPLKNQGKRLTRLIK